MLSFLKGETPLHIDVKRGDQDLANILLQFKASVDEMDDQWVS